MIYNESEEMLLLLEKNQIRRELTTKSADLKKTNEGTFCQLAESAYSPLANGNRIENGAFALSTKRVGFALNLSVGRHFVENRYTTGMYSVNEREKFNCRVCLSDIRNLNLFEKYYKVSADGSLRCLCETRRIPHRQAVNRDTWNSKYERTGILEKIDYLNNRYDN